jgi:hypothetical protein
MKDPYEVPFKWDRNERYQVQDDELSDWHAIPAPKPQYDPGDYKEELDRLATRKGAPRWVRALAEKAFGQK